MQIRVLRSAALALVLCGLAGATHAQTFLDGRVVDSFGVGVANVNIDIKKLSGGGGTPAILNDGTDANGFFHSTILQTLASQTFEVSFYPPPPPASTSLVTIVSPVTVLLNTTFDMGVVALDPGVSISGRCVNNLGAGVAGVNLDIVDAGGNPVLLTNDATDATGNFAFNSPAGDVRLRFDTSTVVGQTVAPIEMPLSLAGNVNLGTLTLAPGFVVSAIARNSSSVAVSGCDLDVFDVTTHTKLFTPNDNTNAAGLVSVIVPAGTFDFDFCPPTGSTLAPARVAGFAVSANASLGIVVLPPGMLMTGTVTSPSATPLANVNIDLRDSVTDVDVPLCNDFTLPNGTYSMRVPVGTYTVKFRPTGTMPFSEDVLYNVAIAGTTALNGQLHAGFLPGCPGDGTTATACPCGNNGAAGRGCANSVNALGALLRADGSTSVNPNTGVETVVLHVSGMPNVASVGAIFLQGDAFNAAGSTFGDGILCAGGQILRLGSKAMLGGLANYPETGNAAISVRGGVTPGSGSVRWYTTYYRNAAAAFCPPATFNSTNSVQITW